MKRLSTAILCIARNEQPYLTEWIEHHLKLGFDSIYLVSTDECYQDIIDYFDTSEFKSKVSLYHFNQFERGWQISCYNNFFPKVKEDWLMVLDIDEFLHLGKHENVQCFLNSMDDEISQIQLPWLNLVSQNYFQDKTVDILGSPQGYASDHVKSLVRCKDVAGINPHAHNIRNSKNALSSGQELQQNYKHELFVRDTSYYNKHPFVMHCSSRGHFDVLMRVIDHQFFNSKSGDGERKRLFQFLTEGANWQTIPNRFLMLKFYETMPRVSLTLTTPNLMSTADTDSLFKLFLRNIKKIVDFNPSERSVLEQSFETQYNFQAKLNSLDLSGRCDVEEYLQCGSQLEYVEKLRRRL
jgi:hypothetical protein